MKFFTFIHSFLQDSLDLGHDDLQRTLQQSNMASNPGRGGGSSNGHGGPSPHAVDLNPMEFIGVYIITVEIFFGIFSHDISDNFYSNDFSPRTKSRS